MRPDDSDKSSDSDEWDDPSELDWNEFDWESYLKEQDEVLLRYLGFYAFVSQSPQRLDEAANLMGWEQGEWNGSIEDGAPPVQDADLAESDEDDSPQPYTLHKNPVFIATQALFMSLTRPWEVMVSDATHIPASVALPYISALYRAQQQSLQAVQSLDFGDFTLAISHFKRTLSAINQVLALLPAPNTDLPDFTAFRNDATMRLFDLREVCLRVMNECRLEAARPPEADDNDEE